MDSILVFDDFKHCFRELDTSNYNDDLVVGSVFFTRDAINVIEKYYRIIGYIICDDKGVYYPIDVRKNDIAILEGTYNCIEDELKKELVPYNIKIAPAAKGTLLMRSEEIVMAVLLNIPMLLIFQSMALPFLLKYEAEKGRIALAAMIGGIVFVVIFFFKRG